MIIVSKLKQYPFVEKRKNNRFVVLEPISVIFAFIKMSHANLYYQNARSKTFIEEPINYGRFSLYSLVQNKYRK